MAGGGESRWADKAGGFWWEVCECLSFFVCICVYICVCLPQLVAMCPRLGDSQGEHGCMWLWDCMISSGV